MNKFFVRALEEMKERDIAKIKEDVKANNLDTDQIIAHAYNNGIGFGGVFVIINTMEVLFKLGCSMVVAKSIIKIIKHMDTLITNSGCR